MKNNAKGMAYLKRLFAAVLSAALVGSMAAVAVTSVSAADEAPTTQSNISETNEEDGSDSEDDGQDGDQTGEEGDQTGEEGDEDGEEEKLDDIYFYFDNTETQWENVYAYWWNSDESEITDYTGDVYNTSGTEQRSYSMQWPGFRMERIEGSQIYRALLPFGAERIIFGNGVSDEEYAAGAVRYQTLDMEFDPEGDAGLMFVCDMDTEKTDGSKITYDGDWSVKDDSEEDGGDEEKPTIEDAEIELSDTEFTYTGSAVTPVITIVYDDKTLKEGTDYSLSFKDNTEVGSATVVITGLGTFDGSSTEEIFDIIPAEMSKTTLRVSSSSLTYTGSALLPAVTVKYGDKLLTVGKDYKLVYKNNINAGKAAVTATGIGNFTGSKSANFNIGKKNVSKLKATFKDKSFTYTGKAQKTTVTVKDGGKTLKENTDYTVSYKNNTKPGKATVTITGKDNYTGSVSKKITIAKVTVKKAKITNLSSSYSYTGKAIKPSVKLTYSGKTLKNGTDYTLSFSSNKKIGTATVKITGKGGFSGSVTKKFKITPKKAKLSSVAADKSQSVKVSWKKDKNSGGYEISYATGKNFRNEKKITVSGSSKTSYVINKLKKGTRYYVRIRSFKKVSGKKIYGDYSDVKKVTVR